MSIVAVRDSIADDERSAEGEQAVPIVFLCCTKLARVPGAVLESSTPKGKGKKRSSAPERS